MLRRLLALGSGAALTLAVFSAFDGAEAQSPPASVLDDGSVSLRLTAGEADAEPTDWSGRAGGRRWTLRTERATKKGKAVGFVLPSSATIQAPRGEEVELTTPQGRETLRPVELGGTAGLFGGRLQVETLPPTAAVAAGPLSEDYPACAATANGTAWCAYVRYDPGSPVDREATQRGEFDSLRPDDNGDQILLLRYEGGAFSEVAEVTGPGRDVWRPSVVADADGKVWIVWSDKRAGDWELLARRFDPATGGFGVERRLTAVPGADVNPVVARDSQGKLWVAWQAWRTDGNVAGFEILLGELTGAEINPQVVSSSQANDWNPSIAADSSGGVWVAWDTYGEGNYDVYARRYDGGRPASGPRPVATSARFEARPSIAVDAQDRLWVAYEDAAEQWGKDYGDRWPGRQAAALYENRWIRIRILEGDRVLQTAGELETSLVEDYRDDPKKPTVYHHKISAPRLALDGEGRAWVLFRKHPDRRGLGERWASYAAYYDGARWSKQIPMLDTIGLMDNRPALTPLGDGVLALHSTDKRVRAVADAQDGDLHASWLEAATPLSAAALREVDPTGPVRPMTSIHPDETNDVARLRQERIEVGGKTYRYLRGEFHRHTEVSSHRDWDGPLEDVFRYGLDAASMDWIGPGDHDYGRENEYLWWYTQKLVDIYYHPGQFLPMFTYERSMGYPSGHRNVMFAERGVRPLPRQEGRERLFGTYEDGSDDIRNLYSYLRAFGGICSSHTSATNMGTDWRDADEEVEPVVEIFQGHRLSAEEPNAPMAPSNEEDAIQGFRPLGFVWEAFKRGRKLGFQASSDHISTHISYAVAIVEEPTREGLIAAFKKRHSYAAQDNILLDIRSGEHMMGDEFSTSEEPRLEIRVEGTTPIRVVDVVRQVGTGQPEYVARFEPGRKDVEMTWTDRSAVKGSVNMYYVRVQQENSALAWASPMWVDYR